VERAKPARFRREVRDWESVEGGEGKEGGGREGQGSEEREASRRWRMEGEGGKGASQYGGSRESELEKGRTDSSFPLKFRQLQCRPVRRSSRPQQSVSYISSINGKNRKRESSTHLSSNSVSPPNIDPMNTPSGFSVRLICTSAPTPLHISSVSSKGESGKNDEPGKSLIQCIDKQLMMHS
jgi:hypothetical protein